MTPQRLITVEGKLLSVARPGGAVHRQVFASDAEAAARGALIAEALDWIGTPFRNCADVKGPNGGVDCAMSLARWHIDAGILPVFDPRPYPPQWFLHHDEERFLGWVVERLGGIEVTQPSLGDVVLYRNGRCFSHGALFIGNGEVIHAYFKSRLCHISNMTDTDLALIGANKPRPVKFFSVWRPA